MTFAQRLRSLIADGKMTQAEVARAARLDAAEVSRLCVGRKSPTAKQLERLAKVFRVTVVALVEGVDDVDELREQARDIDRGTALERALAAETEARLQGEALAGRLAAELEVERSKVAALEAARAREVWMAEARELTVSEALDSIAILRQDLKAACEERDAAVVRGRRHRRARKEAEAALAAAQRETRSSALLAGVLGFGLGSAG